MSQYRTVCIIHDQEETKHKFEPCYKSVWNVKELDISTTDSLIRELIKTTGSKFNNVLTKSCSIFNIIKTISQVISDSKIGNENNKKMLFIIPVDSNLTSDIIEYINNYLVKIDNIVIHVVLFNYEKLLKSYDSDVNKKMADIVDSIAKTVDSDSRLITQIAC